MTEDFSSVARQAIRQWSDIFEVVKEEKSCQPRILSKNIP